MLNRPAKSEREGEREKRDGEFSNMQKDGEGIEAAFRTANFQFFACCVLYVNERERERFKKEKESPVILHNFLILFFVVVCNFNVEPIFSFRKGLKREEGKLNIV